MAVVELFRALGDPSRLEMVRRLSGSDFQTITTISQGLEISRQGARKHLQILEQAEIVILEAKGRDTSVRLNRATLDQGRDFIVELERKWDSRLEALRKYVEDEM
jgi:DNA-binding transcriptional ArsR family regulator